MREAARRLVGWLGGWWAEPGPGGAAAWCLGAGDRRRYYEPQMPHMARNIMAGPTVESLYSVIPEFLSGKFMNRFQEGVKILGNLPLIHLIGTKNTVFKEIGKRILQKDTALNKRGRFEDLMEERRQSSDLKYAMRCYTPVVYKDLVPRTPSALRSVVLKSDPVQYVVKQLAKETGESTDIINDEAADILEKMGHGLRLSVVRFFAFTLSKIFKALFQKVHVNEEGIQKLHQAIQEYPVVLLPSHRSYIDFLMLSYIMYTYDLSLPVIAAGMDFMGMKIVGEMLRMSGAFFIRRSFGGDRLYWAVFSEYVKTILRNGDAPVEFFVEGTRSRTGKSLMPKLGLLNIAIEPFLMGEVFDMYLIPVSISYDRILEESLYAHELLGVPKPKESTSGLLKARKILSENFGSIHVYFGQPVSVRSLATGIVRRSHYNLLPRHIPRKPSGDVYRFLDDLGHKIVVLQQKNMVISPWVLMATVIIQNLPGLTLSDLTRQTLWLKTIAETFGAFIDWPENLTPDKVIRSNLALHHNIVKTIKNQIVLCQEDTPAKFTVEKIFKHTISVLMCASYRNQILHVFVRPALVAIAFQNAQSCRREDIYGCFSYLREVLSDEFVFLPGNIVKDFDEGLYLLMKSGAIQGSQADLYVSEKGNATISFLSVMFAPFLEGYQVICKYLLRLEFTDDLTEKRFIAAFRNYAAELILSGAIKYNEVLSVDMQKNALAALTRLGAVEKLKIAEGIIFKVNEQTLSRVVDMLVPRMPMKSATVARL